MMKVIFIAVASILLHIWFYLVFAFFTVVSSPVLFLTLLHKRGYPTFYWIARNIWARGILYSMGQFPTIRRESNVDRHQSHILIANHGSMLDIMMMYIASKNPFVFIGKKELTKYPLFGFLYKRVSILVDRKNLRSRQAAYQDAQQYIDRGVSICVFPEGGIPSDTRMVLDSFKDGAFRLSLENNLPIIPIIFFDNKRHFPYAFTKSAVGKLRATVKQAVTREISVAKGKEDIREFKEHLRNIILNELEKYNRKTTQKSS